MKLQFGILYRDERVADRQDLETLLGDYAGWNAETSGQFFDGPLLMGYRGDKITWEEEFEAQPFSLGPYSITFDGRLDNRNDVAAKLGIDPTQLADPVLVAQAFERFGCSILADLIGEFALVIWRSDTRTCTFVRSSDGSRPLYYVFCAKFLMWSSDFGHLVRVSGVDHSINSRYVLEYLLVEPKPTHTPLRNVGVVPPGVSIRFANGRFSDPDRLWNPYTVQPLRPSSDPEYEERLRHELAQAVKARLRAKGVVFSELSGGLDSSSIVLVADQILRRDNIDPRMLLTFSCIYNQSQTSDESRFVHHVEALRQVPSIYIPENDQSMTLALTDIHFTGLPNTMHVCPGRYHRFANHMRQNGARVLLTGLGGDHIFCNVLSGVPVIADLLREFKLRNAHNESRLWSRCASSTYFDLLTQAVKLLFFSEAPHRLTMETGIPKWVIHKHARDILVRTWRLPVFQKASTMPSVGWRAHMVERLFTSISNGMTFEYKALFVSHPYTHRPLLEFCLGLPISQLLRSDFERRSCAARSIMRRALREILPREISGRLSKGSMDEAIARAAQRELGQLPKLTKWHLAEEGYIDPTSFSNELTRLAAGLTDMSGAVVRTCTMERWWRSLISVTTSSRMTSERFTMS